MAEITLKYIFLKELSQTPHQAHLMGNKREKKKKKRNQNQNQKPSQKKTQTTKQQQTNPQLPKLLDTIRMNPTYFPIKQQVRCQNSINDSLTHFSAPVTCSFLPVASRSCSDL